MHQQPPTAEIPVALYVVSFVKSLLTARSGPMLTSIKEKPREAGENPTDTADVARFDRKRKDKKLFNTEWRFGD
jgi:hypothetical protein